LHPQPVAMAKYRTCRVCGDEYVPRRVAGEKHGYCKNPACERALRAPESKRQKRDEPPVDAASLMRQPGFAIEAMEALFQAFRERYPAPMTSAASSSSSSSTAPPPQPAAAGLPSESQVRAMKKWTPADWLAWNTGNSEQAKWSKKKVPWREDDKDRRGGAADREDDPRPRKPKKAEATSAYPREPYAWHSMP
jgi:hypothetical protein